MANLMSEIRYAWRALYRAPGFSLTVVATLAIAIGAAVAIFAVVNALLLRPLAYPDSDRMVMVWQDLTRRGGPEREWFTPPDFMDLREQTSSFEALAAVGDWGPAMATEDGAEALEGAIVTSGYFDVVGVQPALGAPFHPATEQPGATPVVVLGHELWQRVFGGERNAVGSTIRLNDVAHEIVGVMPEGFRDPLFADAQVWRARVLNTATCGRGCYTIRVLGRLKPGVNATTATAEAATVAARLAAEHSTNRDVDFNVVGLKDDLLASTRPALIALSVAVALLLLIAIVNVANLLVARAGVRERELAIRTALGAGRGAIVRQMLVETAVLGVVGAAAGALLALWAVDLLTALAPEGTPRIEQVRVDGAALLFALMAGILAAVGAALGPALYTARGRLAELMKDSGGHRTSPGRRRGRSALVVAEVAIALMLLIGSGLTLRSLSRLQQVDPGFQPRGLVTGEYFLPPARYPGDDELRAFIDQATEPVAAIPGVQEVAVTSRLPMTQGDSDTGFEIEGRVLGPDENPGGSWYRMVSPNYFDVMGMRIVAGRSFTADDRAGGVNSIVVNEEFQRRHFPGGSAIGARLGFGGEQRAEIVGVVADARDRGLGSAPIVEMFFTTAQVGTRSVTFVVRTERPASAVGTSVRDAVRTIDPALPPPAFRAMEERVAQTIALPRLYSAFFTFFAAVALLLAGVGVYGLTAYTVGQRRQEIGIRMALGARARDVVAMVVGQSMLLTAAGLGIGMLAALVLARPLAALLYETRAHDIVTFAAVPTLLAAIALVACWLPARRAARVQPLNALRSE
ncbi:MAG: ABC transporter permease [Gemmatimonadetes bacterium]|nr:ABC transporter permease [Gemmatimonadota bacterium]